MKTYLIFLVSFSKTHFFAIYMVPSNYDFKLFNSGKRYNFTSVDNLTRMSVMYGCLIYYYCCLLFHQLLKSRDMYVFSPRPILSVAQ